MAGSRGGGFSGGGGRSFSSHGTSGGRSGPSFSTRPFAGAKAYFYISRTGRHHEFYSTAPPKRQSKTKAVVLSVISAIILVAVAAFIFTACLPSKLSTLFCTPTGIYLDDNAGLIKDKESFNTAMKEFYGKTGIEPYLYTMHEDGFPSTIYGELDAYALTDFAYDEYYNICSDEGHYLITIVKCNDGEYLWCEMAGDNSINLIDDDAFANMQVNMLMLTHDSDVGKVVSECMTALSNDVFVITSSDKFALAMICVAAAAFLAFIAVNLISALKRIEMMNEYCDYQKSGGAKNQKNEFRNY